MKVFSQDAVREAIRYAGTGGQALHLHRFVGPGTPHCCKTAVTEGHDIAHLFDQNLQRLVTTAKRYGVKVVRVDRIGTPQQHVDLCCRPLVQALVAVLPGPKKKTVNRNR